MKGENYLYLVRRETGRRLKEGCFSGSVVLSITTDKAEVSWRDSINLLLLSMKCIFIYFPSWEYKHVSIAVQEKKNRDIGTKNATVRPSISFGVFHFTLHLVVRFSMGPPSGHVHFSGLDSEPRKIGETWYHMALLTMWTHQANLHIPSVKTKKVNEMYSNRTLWNWTSKNLHMNVLSCLRKMQGMRADHPSSLGGRLC